MFIFFLYFMHIYDICFMIIILFFKNRDYVRFRENKD